LQPLSIAANQFNICATKYSRLTRLPMKFCDKLSKDNILDRVSQEDIFRYYTGMPVSGQKRYCSPLRDDRSPGCSFYYSNSNRLYFQDWATGYSYDCFDIVMHLFGCGFVDAMKRINEDMALRLDVTGSYGGGNASPRLIRRDEGFSSPPCRISARSQDFTHVDHDYWGQYGLQEDDCRELNIFSARHVFKNDLPVLHYRSQEPIYGYEFDDKSMKAYRPLSEKIKWMSNASADVLQGWEHLPDRHDILIVTKSYKDVAVLRKLGVPATAPQSETVKLSEDKVRQMQQRFGHVYLLYDNDDAGKEGARQRNEETGFHMVFIPKASGEKDISDYRKTYGEYKSRTLIDKLIA
jgi:hypothetical protein